MDHYSTPKSIETTGTNEVDAETGLISFDVIRSIQAGRELYASMCSFVTLYNHTKFN